MSHAYDVGLSLRFSARMTANVHCKKTLRAVSMSLSLALRVHRATAPVWALWSFTRTMCGMPQQCGLASSLGTTHGLASKKIAPHQL